MRENFLTLEMINEAFQIRDRQIERVRIATETRKKMIQAKCQEEFEGIALPEEYRKFGDYGYHAMCSNVSGFTLKDRDGAEKCFYGALGSQTSLLVPTVFRGEIMDYGKTSGYSSLGRTLIKCGDNGEQDRYLSLLEANIRIEIFAGFLSNFRQFREFPFGTPRPELIAQHYGLNTQYLDVTDDIKVAMFFACCKHIENNVYEPITEKHVEDMGEYGVIYVGIADIPCIGCQPFCRCQRLLYRYNKW